MTDRALLEAAAKAAGIPKPFQVMRDGTWVFDEPRMKNWNPLTDDGDALRLAVKLNMNISHADPASVKVGWGAVQKVPFTLDGMGPWHWKEWLREHADNREVATRRAIVRAAAALSTQQENR